MNNSWIAEAKKEQARKDARNLRFQRPIAKELNFQTINEELWEIQEVCSDVQWMTEDEDRMDNLFDGDPDQAWEFRMAFSDLMSDCGKMRNAINAVEVWDEYEESDPGSEPYWGDAEPGDNVPTIFDLFFPAIDGDDGYLGYDSYEGDFFGLDYYEGEAARKLARKKVTRLTKDQLLDAAGQCMKIARQYLALKYRYQCLKSALDVLSQENMTTLRIVKGIEEAYDKAEKETEGFKWCHFQESLKDLDRAISELPDQFWIE